MITDQSLRLWSLQAPRMVCQRRDELGRQMHRARLAVLCAQEIDRRSAQIDLPDRDPKRLAQPHARVAEQPTEQPKLGGHIIGCGEQGESLLITQPGNRFWTLPT